MRNLAQPKDIVDALRAHFNMRCGNNLIALKTQLWSLQLRPGQSIAALCDEIARLETRCTSQGSTLPDADKCAILLKALPEREYEGVLTQISVEMARLPANQVMEYAEVRSTVELFSQTLQASSKPAKESALMGVTPNACERCGTPGHSAATCRKPWADINKGKQHGGNANKGKQRRRVPSPNDTCNKCGKTGHWANKCPDNGREQVRKAVRFADKEKAINSALLLTPADSNSAAIDADYKPVLRLSHAMVPKKPVRFILDTGATAHVINDKRLFSTLSPAETYVVGVGGHAVAAIAEGTLRGCPGNTLLVPASRENILSVPQLTQHGWRVAFEKDTALVRNAEGEQTLALKDTNSLYTFERCFITERDTVDMMLWHYRLGHAIVERIRAVCQGAGIDISTWPDTLPDCEVCTQAKFTKAPVKHTATHYEADRALLPGERIDTDLVDPFPASPSGKRFVLDVVDRHSRMRWVYPLSHKADAAGAMAELLDRELGPSQRMCTRLHADRGGEFCRQRVAGVV